MNLRKFTKKIKLEDWYEFENNLKKICVNNNFEYKIIKEINNDYYDVEIELIPTVFTGYKNCNICDVIFDIYNFDMCNFDMCNFDLKTDDLIRSD